MRFSASPVLLAALLFASAWADDYHDEMPRLKALDQRCEQARTARLAPIRENLIRDCTTDQRRSLQDCQGEFSTHGESTTGVRGNVVKGLFYDLPECQAAAQAWEAWQAKQPLRR